MTTAPTRVVAVTNGGSKRGFPYVVAAVYELKPRKKDGIMTYRRSDVHYGVWPHRSVRLATQDAEDLSKKLGYPLWKNVRQDMTAERAVEIHTRREESE